MDHIILAYIDHLRGVASQYSSADGEIDLIRKRALKERAEHQ